MANSLANLSRRVCRSLVSNPRGPQLSYSFCTSTTDTVTSSSESSDLDIDSPPSESSPPSKSPNNSNAQRRLYDTPLENGLDVGVYKAILVGQVGQTPVQKKLKMGDLITMFTVGTGGIHNYRRPYENEQPQEYANRCAVQWHRISVRSQLLGNLAMKHLVPGSIVYLEGNLETKIFADPITGLVQKRREVAIYKNGRLVILGNSENAQRPTLGEMQGAGFH
ncbi:Primosome PriB/single-strand DNA-binding protein [Corchorus capsularis]|uniref:Primosome PriB/single-strand DNA-binding protein n=1 Tax=Corchorus capsularis TaxID=210143 RepID=A0A1R3JHX5_COCAP|nr:Primosome PriB/single-strand DNA-binding protein [Corchorus capsularis]